ncbi:MAG: hypothetical protein ACLFUJ_11780 [Phycisphaerae bacterium]
MQLQCPICQSERFDHKAREISTGHFVWYGESGRHGPKTRIYGRACLGCGYVITFVDLNKLHERFPQPDMNVELMDRDNSA